MKTDSQLQRDISDELNWEPAVHAARIGVEVKDGIVTLVGGVDTYAEKWSAERSALRVAGVRALTTELKVQLTDATRRTDADIARSAERSLEWTSTLPTGAIQAMVEGGWITLSGKVAWQYQRQAASDGVRHIPGAIGVTDEVVIKPSLPMIAVKADIEAALRRTSIANAEDITVAVHGADVALGGTVRTWAEREAATNSAWGTPGVLNVVDNLRMVY